MSTCIPPDKEFPDQRPGPEDAVGLRHRQECALNFFRAMTRGELANARDASQHSVREQQRWTTYLALLEFDQQGMTVQEIARQLERSKKTVYRARQELRLALVFLDCWLFDQDRLQLSPDHKKVLNLLCIGRNRKQIICTLKLSPYSVEEAYRNINQQLDESFRYYLRQTKGLLRLLKALLKQCEGFELTEQSLAHLKKDGIPKKILDNLELIKNQHFNTENEFLKAVERVIGEEETGRYKKTILKHAKT